MKRSPAPSLSAILAVLLLTPAAIAASHSRSHRSIPVGAIGFIRDAVVDASGNLIVVDRVSASVLTGRPGALRTITLPQGNGLGLLGAPSAVGRARAGRIVIADWRGKVSIFDVSNPQAPRHELSIAIKHPYDACGSSSEIFVANPGKKLVSVFDYKGKHLRDFGSPTELNYKLKVKRAADLRLVADDGALLCDESNHVVYYYNWVLGYVTKYSMQGATEWRVRLDKTDFVTLEAQNGFCCAKMPSPSGRILEGAMPMHHDAGVLQVYATNVNGASGFDVYSIDVKDGHVTAKTHVPSVAVRGGGAAYTYVPGQSSTISMVSAK
jgi:hypothetical protein